MKTFIVKHSGLFVDGFSIVTAKNKTQAKQLIESNMSCRLKQNVNTLKIRSITEINTETPNAIMISDGDFVIYKDELFQ